MDSHDAPLEIEPGPAAADACAASPRPFPQFTWFLTGGVITALGCLLPFGPAVTGALVPESIRDQAVIDIQDGARGDPAGGSFVDPQRSPALEHGYESFAGAIILLIAIWLVAAMRASRRDNRIRLGAVIAMLLPCAWSWKTLIEVHSAIPGFEIGAAYRLGMLEHFARHVGSGFLLVALGSTYVALGFLRALAGAALAGKQDGPGAAAGKRRRR